MPKLSDYAQMLKGKKCVGCSIGDLGGQPIEHYSHIGGYKVDGFKDRQWLSVDCPRCGTYCAFWKLGIPGKATEKEQEQEFNRRIREA